MLEESLKEVEAMKGVLQSLSGLEDSSATRVLEWVGARYGVKPQQEVRRDAAIMKENAAIEYRDLPHLFDAANPRTENEKVLAAGYWFQKVQGQSDIEAGQLNRELKNLGHKIANISKTLTSLTKQKPALAMQTQKTGSSRQARKKYRLTHAGIVRVEQMLGRASEETAESEALDEAE